MTMKIADSSALTIVEGIVERCKTNVEGWLIIPDGVTKLGCDAFAECTSLQKVTIPNGVVEIGNDFAFNNVFAHCKSLVSVEIPPSVTKIGSHTFFDCPSLREIIIPPSVTEISHSAFWGCESLVHIGIPASVTRIGYSAFRGCRSLKKIIIPPSVTEIDDYAFFGCESLAHIEIPSSVTRIGQEAFSGCAIERLDHPCLQIEDGIASKDGVALYCTQEKDTVTIPQSVTKIDSAFHSHNRKLLKSIILPPSMKEIEAGTFGDFEALVSVNLPESLTAIGKEAFLHCTSLKSVAIPSQIQEIEKRTFYCCENLTEVVIPSGVKRIAEEAFARCTSLKSVVIPDTVTEIGERAFFNCTNLTQVSLPASLERIGPLAFKNCNLRQLEHPCLQIQDGLVINGGTLEYCAIQSASIIIPQGVTKIGERAFYRCENLLEIEIPSSVTEIADGAFNFCTSLAKITLPQGIRRIGKRTFADCRSLKSMVIPQGVTEIGEEAFAGCRSLSQVIIPDTVTKIENFAFGSCDIRELNHQCLQIQDGFACRGTTVLYCVQERPILVIPEGMTEIAVKAFTDRNADRKYKGNPLKTYLTYELVDWEGEYRVKSKFDFFTKLIIAKSITHIRARAFSYLPSLETIVFPDTHPFFDRSVEELLDGNFDDDTLDYLNGLPLWNEANSICE